MYSGLPLLQVEESAKESNDDGDDDGSEHSHGGEEERLGEGGYAEQDGWLVLHPVDGVDDEGDQGGEEPGEDHQHSRPEHRHHRVLPGRQDGHQHLVHLEQGEHDHVLHPDEES